MSSPASEGAAPAVIVPRCFAAFPEVTAGFGTRAFSDTAPRVLILKQIHSSIVHTVTHDTLLDYVESQKLLAGDAWVTQETGITLGIRTADCAPLLFYDPVHRVIAAAHAGWRGLVGGIIETTLSTMARAYGSCAADVRVAIGPAICQACFEIGPEVAAVFRAKLGEQAPLRPGTGDRRHLDLAAACGQVLTRAGVPATQIDALILCTACRTDWFYSYRKEGPKTGRLVAFIGVGARVEGEGC